MNSGQSNCYGVCGALVQSCGAGSLRPQDVVTLGSVLLPKLDSRREKIRRKTLPGEITLQPQNRKR